eukprot:jgi/Psemu1/304304/fgenesh1_kg.145_\
MFAQTEGFDSIRFDSIRFEDPARSQAILGTQRNKHAETNFNSMGYMCYYETRNAGFESV